MQLEITVAALVLLSLAGYFWNRRRVLDMADGTRRNLHSLPYFHGSYVLLLTLIPGLVFLGIYLLFHAPLVNWLTVNQLSPELRNQGSGDLSLLFSRIEQHAGGGQTFGELPEGAQGAAEFLRSAREFAAWAVIPFAIFPAAAGFFFAQSRISTRFRARNATERIVRVVMIICAALATLTTFGIVMSVLFEAIRFFRMEPITEFLFTLEWNPGSGMGETDEEGAFGVAPLFVGTLLIATIAMCVAVPLGLLSAIYLAEFADKRVRKVLKPMLEVLAGIPTVVYGVFAALTVSPLVIDVGTALGFNVGAKVALAAGMVMGIMLIPFISSLVDDAISAVPDRLRNGAYSMGATQGETITRVVLPAALPGIVGAILLAISRAVGETMIVLLAAGLRANLTFNPLDTTTTVTVQIANLLTGDQRFDSAKTLSAFALGLLLFIVTLILNVGALKFQQRYQEKYD